MVPTDHDNRQTYLLVCAFAFILVLTLCVCTVSVTFFISPVCLWRWMILILLCTPIPHVSINQAVRLFPHTLFLLLVVLLHLLQHSVSHRLAIILVCRRYYGGVVLLIPAGLRLPLVGAVGRAAVIRPANRFKWWAVSLVRAAAVTDRQTKREVGQHTHGTEIVPQQPSPETTESEMMNSILHDCSSHDTSQIQ